MKLRSVYRLFSILLFVLFEVEGDQKFGLELRYATNIIEVPAENQTDVQESNRSNNNDTNDDGINICHLNQEELYQVCEDAVKTRYCQRHGFVMLRGKRRVLDEKYYEITYGGCYNYGIPPQTSPACLCPTLPPLYLKSGSIPGVVTVIIDGATASALENSI